jgi:signal peptidase
MRRVLHVLTSIVLVLAAAAAVVLVVPVVRGEPSRLVIVSGHSMDPTFHTGDLVLAWPTDDYRVGDIAPYRVPEGEPGEGGLVIHRIAGGDAEGGFVMQGDNNPTPDIWMPRADDIIGRKVLMVPRLGELMAWARQPAVLAAIVAGLFTAIAVSGGLQRASTDDDGVDDDVDPDDAEVIDLREPSGALPPDLADSTSLSSR